MKKASTFSEFVVTGADGFLGRELVRTIRRTHAAAAVHEIGSPRNGGIDLTAPAAPDLLRRSIRLERPHEALLIHCAAVVDWNHRAGLDGNVAMARILAEWAAGAGVATGIMVSGINVYPRVARVTSETVPDPPTMYGKGKLEAERSWERLLPEGRSIIARLHGIWGWQEHPTLFWNQVLRAAAGCAANAHVVVTRRRSRRNYVSVADAVRCLLNLASEKRHGIFRVAGAETVDAGHYVEAVARMPGNRLRVKDEDDGGSDAVEMEPSAAVRRFLRPFSDNLEALWANRHEATGADHA